MRTALIAFAGTILTGLAAVGATALVWGYRVLRDWRLH